MSSQCHRRIPEFRRVLPPQQKPNTRIRWFFRASRGTGSPGASSSARPGSSGRDSTGPNKQRRSTSRPRTRERGGDRDVGDKGSSTLRRPPASDRKWRLEHRSDGLQAGGGVTSVKVGWKTRRRRPVRFRLFLRCKEFRSVKRGYRIREDELRLAGRRCRRQ